MPRTRAGRLVLRNVDVEIMRELEIRAARNGRSVESEHREILSAVLAPKRHGSTLQDLLLAMPAVGEDSDFDVR
jgi:antitoxin FitA